MTFDDLQLIQEAEEVLPENWEDITDIIQQADSSDTAKIISNIQHSKQLEYEDILYPPSTKRTKGPNSYKKEQRKTQAANKMSDAINNTSN